jgi:hypothetical protein
MIEDILNRRWLVLPSSFLPSVNFTEVLEPNAESLAKSNDGTLAIVKYDVTVVEQDYVVTGVNPETGEPWSYTVLAGTYGRPAFWNQSMIEYDHAQIIEILNSPAWKRPMPSAEAV